MSVRYIIKKTHVTLTPDGEIDDWSYSIIGEPFGSFDQAEAAFNKTEDDQSKHFISKEQIINDEWVEVWRSDQDFKLASKKSNSNMITEEDIITLGFNKTDEYAHDQSRTVKYECGVLKIELTYE